MNMKLFFISLFALSSIYSYGQQPDYQWYVKDGHPLQGIFYNPIDNIGNSNIALDYVKHPWINPARNSIFIIYEDGNYFLSNDFAPHPLSVNTTVNYSDLGSGYFLNKAMATSVIKYLYFTNEYEGDDPMTEIISVPPGSSVNPVVSVDYSPFPNNKMITAHQDIVTNTDVVLIINNQKIKRTCSSRNINVCYGQISNGTLDNNLFEKKSTFYDAGNLHNVYSADGAFSVNPITSSSGEKCINLDIGSLNSPYTYIALSSDFSASVNDFNVPDGASPLKARFNLYCSNRGLLDSVDKEILSSHDPNYVQLESICKNAQGEQIANYKINFQNNGDTEAENLFVDIELPPCLDPNTIVIKQWSAGGCNSNDFPLWNMLPNSAIGQSVEFVFPGQCELCTIKLPACQASNSIGTIEFCVKEDASQNCDFETCQLQIGYPYTTFDHDQYPIHDFIDIEKTCEQEISNKLKHIVCRRIPSDTCECEAEKEGDFPWEILIGILILIFGYLILKKKKTTPTDG